MVATFTKVDFNCHKVILRYPFIDCTATQQFPYFGKQILLLVRPHIGKKHFRDQLLFLL